MGHDLLRQAVSQASRTADAKRSYSAAIPSPSSSPQSVAAVLGLLTASREPWSPPTCGDDCRKGCQAPLRVDDYLSFESFDLNANANASPRTRRLLLDPQPNRGTRLDCVTAANAWNAFQQAQGMSPRARYGDLPDNRLHAAQIRPRGKIIKVAADSISSGGRSSAQPTLGLHDF